MKKPKTKKLSGIYWPGRHAWKTKHPKHKRNDTFFVWSMWFLSWFDRKEHSNASKFVVYAHHAKRVNRFMSLGSETINNMKMNNLSTIQHLLSMHMMTTMTMMQRTIAFTMMCMHIIMKCIRSELQKEKKKRRNFHCCRRRRRTHMQILVSGYGSENHFGRKIAHVNGIEFFYTALFINVVRAYIYNVDANAEKMWELLLHRAHLYIVFDQKRPISSIFFMLFIRARTQFDVTIVVICAAHQSILIDITIALFQRGIFSVSISQTFFFVFVQWIESDRKIERDQFNSIANFPHRNWKWRRAAVAANQPHTSRKWLKSQDIKWNETRRKKHNQHQLNASFSIVLSFKRNEMSLSYFIALFFSSVDGKKAGHNRWFN